MKTAPKPVIRSGSKMKAIVFISPTTKRPDLINVDGDKIILCQKKDHKTLENFIYQYKHAGLYLDRREAIEYCSEHQDEPAAQALLKLA